MGKTKERQSYPTDLTDKQGETIEPLFMKMRTYSGDNGYRGTFVHEADGKLLMSVEIPEKNKPNQWKILLWRWLVGRTFA